MIRMHVPALVQVSETFTDIEASEYVCNPISGLLQCGDGTKPMIELILESMGDGCVLLQTIVTRGPEEPDPDLVRTERFKYLLDTRVQKLFPDPDIIRMTKLGERHFCEYSE